MFTEQKLSRRSCLKGISLGAGGLFFAPLLQKVAAADEGKHLFLLSGLHSAVMQTTEPSDMDMNIRFGPAIIPSKTGVVFRSYSAVRFPDAES